MKQHKPRLLRPYRFLLIGVIFTLIIHHAKALKKDVAPDEFIALRLGEALYKIFKTQKQDVSSKASKPGMEFLALDPPSQPVANQPVPNQTVPNQTVTQLPIQNPAPVQPNNPIMTVSPVAPPPPQMTSQPTAPIAMYQSPTVQAYERIDKIPSPPQNTLLIIFCVIFALLMAALLLFLAYRNYQRHRALSINTIGTEKEHLLSPDDLQEDPWDRTEKFLKFLSPFSAKKYKNLSEQSEDLVAKGAPSQSDIDEYLETARREYLSEQAQVEKLENQIEHSQPDAVQNNVVPHQPGSLAETLNNPEADYQQMSRELWRSSIHAEEPINIPKK